MGTLIACVPSINGCPDCEFHQLTVPPITGCVNWVTGGFVERRRRRSLTTVARPLPTTRQPNTDDRILSFLSCQSQPIPQPPVTILLAALVTRVNRDMVTTQGRDWAPTFNPCAERPTIHPTVPYRYKIDHSTFVASRPCLTTK